MDDCCFKSSDKSLTYGMNDDLQDVDRTDTSNMYSTCTCTHIYGTSQDKTRHHKIFLSVDRDCLKFNCLKLILKVTESVKEG